MGMLTARRRALRKRLAAQERGETGLEKAWQGKQEAEEGTPLPEGFEARELLQGAGYSTYEDLTGVTAEELQKIPGVGEKTAEKILAQLAERE